MEKLGGKQIGKERLQKDFIKGVIRNITKSMYYNLFLYDYRQLDNKCYV